MQTIVSNTRLLLAALFLHREAYTHMRDARRPFTTGLILIVVVGLVFSLAAMVGDTLESLAAPESDTLEEALWQDAAGMVWFQDLQETDPGMPGRMREQMQFGWQIARWLRPGPLRGALGLLINPLLLVLGWLIYGLWAHLLAIALGGRGGAGQTYGCIALSVSPYLLNLFTVFPYAGVGPLVLLWALVCGYVAVKWAHNLTPGRAFWTTVLALLAVVLSVLVILVALLVAVMAAGGMGRGS